MRHTASELSNDDNDDHHHCALVALENYVDESDETVVMCCRHRQQITSRFAVTYGYSSPLGPIEISIGRSFASL